MSYPRDLDEYPTAELTAELKKRGDALLLGNCIYCGRSPNTPPCRWDNMHSAVDAPDALSALRDKGDREGWDPSHRVVVLGCFVEQHALQETFTEWLKTARLPR